MNIAIIIIGIDGWAKYTLPLIQSIKDYEPSCKIIVVDNASNEPYPYHSECAIVRTERLCYSAAINYGHEQIPGADWHIVLSNDVLCTSSFAHILEEYGNSDVVGPHLCETPIPGMGQVPYLEGWCVCVPRRIWDEVGGWDENYQVSSYEDVDFSHSARKLGYGLSEDKRLPFTHLDQRQRFGLVPDYWDSEAHNRAYFVQKHLHNQAPSNAVRRFINERTLVTHTVELGDDSFTIQDYAGSLTTAFVLRELALNQYGLNAHLFKDRSIILDIGANVGVVSIWLAKQLPNCTIYAYEPATLNYENLVANIELNYIPNVIPINKAVTKDGRLLSIHYNPDNLGGASGFMGVPPWKYEETVESVTLESIFVTHGIDRCTLLKMDVEGAEHEILATCNGLLDRVDFLAMEAHFTPKLRARGYNERTLQRVLQPILARNAAHVAILESAQ